jgi:hypothetical protein
MSLLARSMFCWSAYFIIAGVRRAAPRELLKSGIHRIHPQNGW